MKPVCPYNKYTAEVIFFLFKIAESILDPTIRLYIYQSECQVRYADDVSVCKELSSNPDMEDLVQADSARLIMFYKILLNLPVIFLGLFCGAWSDRIGRKIPVMLPCLGNIFAILMCMCSIVVAKYWMMLLLLGAALLRGLFGKSAVVTMALHSYISDISSNEERTDRLGRLLAMNFFGYFVGSMITGLFVKQFTYDVLFAVAIVLNASCIFIAILCMEESIPTPEVTPANTPDVSYTEESELNGILEDQPEESGYCCRRSSRRRKKTRWQNPFHPKHILESLNVILKKREHNTRLHILVLFGAIFIQQACKSGEIDITMLIVEKSPLSWSKDMYVYLLATDYVCLGLAVFVILPILSQYLADSTLVAIGFLFKSVRLLILAFSHTTWLIYVSVIVGCPSAMVVSGAKSLVSKLADENEVGKAFSLLSCCETLSNLLGSVLFAISYTLTLDVYAGLTFALDSFTCILLFFVIVLLGQDIKKQSKYSLLGSEHQTSYGSKENCEDK